MKYTKEQLQRFCEEIQSQGEDRGLTAWEADFVESVAAQIEARGRLSDRQIELLDRIYAERTA